MGQRTLLAISVSLIAASIAFAIGLSAYGATSPWNMMGNGMMGGGGMMAGNMAEPMMVWQAGHGPVASPEAAGQAAIAAVRHQGWDWLTDTCWRVSFTAHHVIKSVDQSGLAISFLTTRGLRVVTQVHVHATADLAILEALDTQTGTIEPFWDIVSNIHLGETFAASGFPEDLVLGQSGGSPQRLFMGHYQRFMDSESFMGYRYVAGELNIPCPAGLSGGRYLGRRHLKCSRHWRLRTSKHQPGPRAWKRRCETAALSGRRIDGSSATVCR